MEMSKELEKNFDSIIEGETPADDHVLILAEDNSYQSTNNVISSLKKGGSTLKGTIVRVGNLTNTNALWDEAAIVHVKRYVPQVGHGVTFMQYEATELISGVFLLENSKIKMYKK